MVKLCGSTVAGRLSTIRRTSGISARSFSSICSAVCSRFAGGACIVLLGLAVMVALLRKRHVAKIEAIEHAEPLAA